MPTLTIELNGETKIYEMPEGVHVFVGRDPVCDIILPSARVSRKHAVFIFKDGLCGVKDLGSHNGTLLNHQRIAKPCMLHPNDKIGVGPFTLHFTFTNRAKAPAGDSRRAGASGRHEPRSVGTAKTSASRRLRQVQKRRASTSLQRMMEEVEAHQDKSALHGEDTQAYSQPMHSMTRRKMKDPEPEPPTDTAPFDAAPAEEEPAPRPAPVSPVDTEAVPSVPAAEEESASEPEAVRGKTDAIPVGDDMRKAIEERLKVYPRLAELAAERKKYRTRNRLPKNALAELDRQDGELNVIPTLEQAEKLLAARRSNWQTHFDENGNPSESALDVEAGLSLEMFAAEKMALDQWELLIESGKKHLPEICRLGYRVMAPEPLARALDEARVEHSTLLGGAAYCLTLDVLLEEAKNGAEDAQRQMERIRAGTGETVNGKPLVGRVVHKVSRLFKLHKVDKKKLAALIARERSFLTRVKWLTRERRMVEKAMVGEFWKVYADAACRFFPSGEELPLPVRAFFRFGAIGFKPWWMTDSAREYIESNCRDAVLSLETGNGAMNVVYADEYLRAVMRLECSPGPVGPDGSEGAIDEKTDRILRRLINSRGRLRLIKETLDGIKARVKEIEVDLAHIDAEIMESVADGTGNAKRMEALSGERESLATERTNLLERHKRVARFGDGDREVYADTEKLFRESRASLPSPEALLRRECATLAGVSAHVSGQRERFLPLAIHDGVAFSSDSMNAREEVKACLRELEALDPGLFRIDVISARKKANRVSLRCFPVTVIIPALGARGYACHPREGLENGRLAVPTCYSRPQVQRTRMVEILADYRWDTSTMVSGRDVMASDTLAGAFSRLRWNWREHAREKRERGLIFTDQNDKSNWRRVYDTHLQDMVQGGRRLSFLNPECYSTVIEKYMELPEAMEQEDD